MIWEEVSPKVSRLEEAGDARISTLLMKKCLQKKSHEKKTKRGTKGGIYNHENTTRGSQLRVAWKDCGQRVHFCKHKLCTHYKI